MNQKEAIALLALIFRAGAILSLTWTTEQRQRIEEFARQNNVKFDFEAEELAARAKARVEQRNEREEQPSG